MPSKRGGDEGGGGGGRGGGGGLDVLPGVYTVAVSVNGKQLTKPVQVQLDPRSDMTAAQLVTQNQTAAQLNDILARVNRVITGADDLLAQLTSLQTQLRREQGGGGGWVVQQGQVLGDVDGAIKDLRHFRDSVLARPLQGLGYRQYPRLREEAQTVAGMVSRPMMPPTAGELLRMNELRTEADQAQARLGCHRLGTYREDQPVAGGHAARDHAVEAGHTVECGGRGAESGGRRRFVLSRLAADAA